MRSMAAGLDRAMHRIEAQGWLDRPGFRLEHAAALGFNLLGGAGRPARTVLHGTRLGHPLHPLLTDVPVGAWTVTAVFDGVDVCRGGRSGLRAAASVSVGIGLAGAAAALITGFTDWQFTEGDARRLGLAHAGGNAAVVALYGASLRRRRRGHYGSGRTLSGAGYLLLVASAYLGGTLSFRHRVGVDHADRELQPDEFVSVLPVAELSERPRAVHADGVPLVLLRQGETIIALGDRCAHQGGPMSEGVVIDGQIVCPWHGSRYQLSSGRATTGPATAPLPCFDARVRDGQIQVRRRPPVTSAPPGAAIVGSERGDDAGH